MAATRALVEKLKTLYKETGGEKDFDEEQRVMFSKAVGTFDARKVKKMDFTRQKIKERNELLKKGRKTKVVIKLCNDVNKMVRILKKDFEDLRDIVEKAKIDPKIVEEQSKDVVLLQRHMSEIERLERKRPDEDDEADEEEKKQRASLFGDKQQLMDESTKLNQPLLGKSLDEQLPDDPCDSNLPALDISKSLAVVDEYKKQLDQGLDDFEKKVDALREIATGMHESLDRQDTLLNKIDNKVDREQKKLDDLNYRVEDAIVQVSSSTRWTIILIIVVVLSVIFLVVFAYVAYWIQSILPN